MEHCVFFLNRDRVTEAALIGVLVGLEILQGLPNRPIILLDEPALSKAHDPCDVLAHIARLDDVVALSAEYARAIRL